jgi:predicted CXXCH cytochrome family protein
MLMHFREINNIVLFLFVAIMLLGFSFFNVVMSQAEAGDGAIVLHYPPDKVIMEFDLLNISIGVPENSADLIQAKVNNKKIIEIVPDQTFECFSVRLKPGPNSITITVMNKDEEVYQSTLNVFRRSDLIGNYSRPPADYKKDYFHMKDMTQCSECHTLTPDERDKRPLNPVAFAVDDTDKKAVLNAASTCYSCHNKIASYPYVHGPAAVWSCLSCHNIDSEPKYSVKKPDTDLCFECHKEQKNNWNAKKFTHGPVTIGKCTICHSPHSAAYPFNLHKSTWDLCVNCHAAKGSGRHVLGDAFSTEGHPTRDRPDPIRIGKELSCASCHSPHASNFPQLWAFEVNDMFDLCKKCHYNKLRNQ